MLNRYSILMLALLGGGACSEPIGTVDPAPSPTPEGRFEVVIGGTQSESRTALENDGRTIRWTPGDQIALWASADEGTTYMINAAPFTLRTYNDTYASADFSAMLLSPMPEGTYTYYATYPLPTSTQGAIATYDLPEVQQDAYDGTRDILVASPATGEALAKFSRDETVLAFRHMLHMLRFEIPAGGNRLGAPVKRLEVEFPEGTVATGSVSFDITNPEQTITTTGSNKLTIEFDGEGLTDTEGTYGYAFVLPGQLDGAITFRAYDAAGNSSFTFSSQSISKELLSGRVTPLSVAIPMHRTERLEIVPDWTNLGEAITQIKLKAPAGLSFSDDTTEKTVSAQDGKFYADVYYNTALANAEFGIEYESENALLTGQTLTMPDTFAENVTSTFATTVPYLFEENFFTVESFSFNDNNGIGATDGLSSNGDATDISVLPGWTGARCGIDTGKSLRICCRSEKAVWVPGSYNGRIDTPPLSQIKAGKTVSVQLSFKYSMNRVSSKNSANQHYLVVATHTNSGVQNPTKKGVNTTGSSFRGNSIAEDLTTPYDGTFDNVYQDAKYVTSCTSQSRFVWESYILKNSPDGYYNNWVYLDNIKVKIVH